MTWHEGGTPYSLPEWSWEGGEVGATALSLPSRLWISEEREARRRGSGGWMRGGATTSMSGGRRRRRIRRGRNRRGRSLCNCDHVFGSNIIRNTVTLVLKKKDEKEKVWKEQNTSSPFLDEFRREMIWFFSELINYYGGEHSSDKERHTEHVDFALARNTRLLSAIIWKHPCLVPLNTKSDSFIFTSEFRLDMTAGAKMEWS